MNAQKPLLLQHPKGADGQVAKPDHYLGYYEQYFGPMSQKAVTLLELGVYKGDSLELFASFFENGLILGVDANPVVREFSTSRIKFYQGLQDDPSLYARIMQDNDLNELDIVIDDCSHIGSLTLQSFKLLFPRLKQGGFYIIEDWGTGYWPKWPGGKAFEPEKHFLAEAEEFKSHSSGIPGFVKQLVDEVAMADITDRRGLNKETASLFDYLHIYPGILFIRKS